MSDTSTAPDTPPTHTGKSGFLNKKVGGVPVKWIIIIAVVAAGGAYLWRRYESSKGVATTGTPTVTDTTAGDTAAGAPNTNSTADFSSGAGQYGGTDGSSTTTIGTNAQWAILATNALIGLGQYQPLDIENALNAYINGTALTATQEAIVNQAVGSYGPPPQGILPSTVTTATPTTTTPTSWHDYLTKKGDTLGGVLSANYGTVSTAIKTSFFALNPNLLAGNKTKLNVNSSDGWDLYPGQTVRIPDQVAS